MTNPAPKLDLGFNVIGPLTQTSGLGRASRELIRVLIEHGESVTGFDTSIHTRAATQTSLNIQSEIVTAPDQLTHPINIFILPAHSLSCPKKIFSGGVPVSDRLNVAYIWWEITEIPPHWCVAAQLFDVLLTSSEFIAEAFRVMVPRVPVLLMKQPNFMPTSVTASRKKFNLPENLLLVYTGFSHASDVERKNPYATIEAFRAAFSQNENVRLVIKMTSATAIEKEETINKIKKLAPNDSRLIIIHDELSQTDLFELYASCDIFISLHRSEGLGLILLEAMSLGKPVIATNWSGNLSFMNHTNSCLVGFDFTSTPMWSFYYGRLQIGGKPFWAEPDIAEASQWLLELSKNSALRKQISEKARVDCRAYELDAMKALFADEIKSIYLTRVIRQAKSHTEMMKNFERANRSFKLTRWYRVLVQKIDRTKELLSAFK